MRISIELIEKFKENLEINEYSRNSIEKYGRDVLLLYKLSEGSEIDKKTVITLKEELCKMYKPSSVNSVIAAWNRFFEYCGCPELKVKALKIQKNVFCQDEKMLTKQEYKKMIRFANMNGKERISLIMQTIAATGIRVSELEFITVEAVNQGRASIRLKGKNRVILIPDKLRRLLKNYCIKKGVKKGKIFVSATGRALDRSTIWKDMKRLAEMARVSADKVFPHNLRHLFAREFYKIKKDIVKLADVLGHSNINTTRVYMISSGNEHQKTLHAMNLIL